MCSFYPIDFSVSNVESLFKVLNHGSAMEPNNLHPMLLNRISSTLAHLFYLLFKKYIVSKIVPDCWRKIVVIPIYKKGSQANLFKDRSVSLSPIPCKAMKHHKQVLVPVCWLTSPSRWWTLFNNWHNMK